MTKHFHSYDDIYDRISSKVDILTLKILTQPISFACAFYAFICWSKQSVVDNGSTLDA